MSYGFPSIGLYLRISIIHLRISLNHKKLCTCLWSAVLLFIPLFLDIHNLFKDIHNVFMDILNSFMDILQ